MTFKHLCREFGRQLLKDKNDFLDYLGENVRLLAREFRARTLLDVQQEEEVVPEM